MKNEIQKRKKYTCEYKQKNKKKYYKNLNLKDINDQNKFCPTVKPLFTLW